MTPSWEGGRGGGGGVLLVGQSEEGQNHICFWLIWISGWHQFLWVKSCSTCHRLIKPPPTAPPSVFIMTWLWNQAQNAVVYQHQSRCTTNSWRAMEANRGADCESELMFCETCALSSSFFFEWRTTPTPPRETHAASYRRGARFTPLQSTTKAAARWLGANKVSHVVWF